MASKVSTTSTVVFLLLIFFVLTHAARPDSGFSSVTKPIEVSNKDNDAEENCDGIGEDECLLRRTLEAHTDYIYTQNNKH
ncbi:phytosulfokines 3-like [Carica papaya]|uniref:phytosulfokines 3-like n=1 Tax=Carica papaya TaxID=3649 RepID=UPI000B8D0585|nr:phytosulfokines 3-like [Carica papaya]